MQRLVRFHSCLLILLLAASTLSLATQKLAAEERRGPFVGPQRSVRDRLVDIHHVRLDLDFNWERRQMRGRCTTRLSPFRTTSSVKLDAVDLKIDAVNLVTTGPDGSVVTRPLDFEVHPQSLVIFLDRPYQASEELTLAVDYVVTSPEKGVHFVVPDADEPTQPRIVWTQSEPTDARRWFPTQDSPNERLTSEILATVPEEFFVLSNGELREVTVNEPGRKTWHWEQTQEHVPYLLSVVAGEFEAFEQSYDGIPITSYVPPGRLDEARRCFARTPEMMEFFSERIGYPYPWPKYAQICCDEYSGGMEHTTATTLSLRSVYDERAALDVSSENLVAHELVHQWWGNLLTCKDWAELWLNESFATYFATLWVEHADGQDEATWQRHLEAERYFTEDRDRYRRPLVTYRYEEPIQMFDAHSYPKGARVLHMLRYELGDDAFWRGLQRYAADNAFGVVETADLRSALAVATGHSLNRFFDQWVYHGGHPELRVEHRWDPDQQVVQLRVQQTQTVTDLTPLFEFPVEVDFVTDQETITRRITVTSADETFVFPLSERPRRVVFDPEDWILKKLDFTQSNPQWIDQLANDSRLMPRIRAAQALAKQTTDEAVVAALLEAATSDPFWAVRQTAIESLAEANNERVRETLVACLNTDPKSAVRRAAAKRLSAYPGKETAEALRAAIESDLSYFVAADALRSLVKVDRDDVHEDLIQALERTSHEEVILQAACEGLAEIEAVDAQVQLREILAPPVSADRRRAVLKGLAKLTAGDPETTRQIARSLEDSRRVIRRAAIEALAETADPLAIELLEARRPREESVSMRNAIDDALKKLRDNSQLGKVRRELEDVRSENRQLQERLQRLEEQSPRP